MQDIYTTNQNKLQVSNGDIIFADDLTKNPQNISIQNVNVLAARNYLNMNKEFFLINNIDITTINNFILQTLMQKNIAPNSIEIKQENRELSFSINLQS
ncbi:MAG: hypothetical protein FWE18_04505 [Alphaproteobacteria bacterium]|nr:hypothetical protein [Alphaproteobacteria bacterium]